ncbi:MAG: hypothetical protein ABIH47_09815 [Candidatus Omnitrophota bacterium]
MKHMRQKTIFIATHQGFTTRYLLQTDILARLKEYGHRIVIISPNSNDENFRNDYVSENVFIEQFNYKKIYTIRDTFLYQFFTQTRRFIFPDGLDIATLRDKEKAVRYNLNKKPIKQRIVLLTTLWLAALCRKYRLLRVLFLQIERLLFSKKFHQKIFDYYKPDMLILADVGTIDISNFIMREAKAHNVPVVSIVLSWDNLTAKGIGGVKPDYAVAWNSNMKDELMRYHEVPSERIFVGGIPHFDLYFKPCFPISETEFRNMFGLVEGKKILFYGTASPSSFRENVRILRLLIEGIRDGRVLEPVQVIVRPHPVYYIRSTETIKEEATAIEALCEQNRDIIRLNKPQVRQRKIGCEMPIADQKILGAILKHSNVFLNQFSTLMLEAAIFDLPIINIGFDNFRNIEMKSTELQFRTHLSRVLDTGFARMAESEAQLFELINLYLRDSSCDREKRKVIRENEGGSHKGSAGNAIAYYLHTLAVGNN